jgi:predicted nuclease of predicted toxin-antitoxin system
MRFLVDECTGTSVADWLKSEKHEVFSVFEQWRGVSDDEIIEKCQNEDYILITSDKDFGEMVFRNQKVYNGIILLRCEPNIFKKRIEVLNKLIQNYSDSLQNNFVVVTNDKVRIVTF